jgi:hypothetical protein
MKPVILHCEANVELTTAAKFYQCRDPKLARDFLSAFRSAKDAVEKQPPVLIYCESHPASSRRGISVSNRL